MYGIYTIYTKAVTSNLYKLPSLKEQLNIVDYIPATVWWIHCSSHGLSEVSLSDYFLLHVMSSVLEVQSVHNVFTLCS